MSDRREGGLHSSAPIPGPRSAGHGRSTGSSCPGAIIKWGPVRWSPAPHLPEARGRGTVMEGANQCASQRAWPSAPREEAAQDPHV